MNSEKLLDSLKLGLSLRRKKHNNKSNSTLDFPIIFSSLLDDGSYTCPMVAEDILPRDWLVSCAEKITDPNTVIGFFVTYMHSKSDVTVITRFCFSTQPNEST